MSEFISIHEMVNDIFMDSLELKKSTLENLGGEIANCGQLMIDTLKNNHKILVCGNGGSAAQAQHFSGELLHRFNKKRKALPALALHAEQSGMTAAANDDGYETTFARHLEALGEPGDVLIGMTTSGNSENVVRALKLATKMGLKTICLNGKAGGKINNIGIDHNLIIPSDNTARIQEVHLTIIHIWCYLVDDAFEETEAVVN